jgi:DNA-binding NtrC family response regulator
MRGKSTLENGLYQTPVRPRPNEGRETEALSMARVQLLIDDVPQRMTLRVTLEAAGHTLVDAAPDVVLTDSVETAGKRAADCRAIVLAPASEIPNAVRAMREAGVYGYVYLPLQPGEAVTAVERAAASSSGVENPGADQRTLEPVEMEHIERVLRQCKHNQAKAARVLGIGRNTLWRKLKRAQPKGGS